MIYSLTDKELCIDLRQSRPEDVRHLINVLTVACMTLEQEGHNVTVKIHDTDTEWGLPESLARQS